MKTFDLTLIIFGVLLILFSFLILVSSPEGSMVGMLGGFLFGLGIGGSTTHKGEGVSRPTKP